MSNEILLFIQVLVCFTGTVLAYRLFGKIGLFVVATAAVCYANAEVACQADIFGLAVSLGNVTFVANALCQDILTQTEGEKISKHLVWTGFFASIFIVIVSQVSIRFNPNEFDVIHPYFSEVFGQFSIVAIISLLVFLISNRLNVKIYSLVGKLTTKIWIRTVSSTGISQAVDTILFTSGCCMFKVFGWDTLWELILTTYTIKMVIMLFEIPFVYWASNIKKRGKVKVM